MDRSPLIDIAMLVGALALGLLAVLVLLAVANFAQRRRRKRLEQEDAAVRSSVWFHGSVNEGSTARKSSTRVRHEK